MTEFVNDKIKLISSDGSEFEILAASLKHSKLLKSLPTAPKTIPLPNIRGVILSKVVQFLDRNEQDPMETFAKPLASNQLKDLVQEFYAELVDVDNETLMELLMAANYLDISNLLELCFAKIASYIKDLPPQTIRSNLGITGDFSSEEESTLLEENKWVDSL